MPGGIMHYDDFFKNYLDYTKESEVPVFFSRWSALTGIGAYLGRDFFITHGHFNIYPNMYSMLIGNPGTRKSTAIKVMKKILKLAGYDTVAANKTSKEKFMMDLAEGISAGAAMNETALEDVLSDNLWGSSAENKLPAECFIMADEFNNFIGTGNLEFISLLTELWDYEGSFDNKIKTGKSVYINNPTISILGGSTPTSFSTTFPSEIFGQGFFSRLLLIYGEPNGKRITFPKPPCPIATGEIVERLQRVKIACKGQVTLSTGAELLLDKIYSHEEKMQDVRFESYYSRRLQHLLKLCLIITASRLSCTVSERDVVYANTILTHTEHLMPKALGEFGKAKNSDISHKIISMLDASDHVVLFKDLWTALRADLENMNQLTELMHNLISADKVQSIKSGGFLPKKHVIEEVNNDMLDYSFLTQEEKDIRK